MAKQDKSAYKDDNIKLIRKSNELVEARYKFDIWEMRVFAKTLTMISTNDSDFKTYDLPVGELLKDFNLHDKGDNYQSVKDATEKLMKRVIEVERETPEGIKWFKTPLVVSAEGFKDPKDGNYISIQFHPNLKPYLLELKARYLVYDIRNLWGLSSIYSVRIYELLKQYEKIGKRRFKLEDLRLILGMKQGEYPLYANFKQKVILKAQKDLEASTDIKFSFDEEKQGRKIDLIIFHIHKNAKYAERQQEEVAKDTKAVVPQTPPKVMHPKTDFLTQIYEQVSAWGITEATLKSLIDEHGAEKVKSGLSVTLDGLKNQRLKENVAGFFVRAVKQGWKNSDQIKQDQAQLAKEKAALKKSQAELELKPLVKQLSELIEERRAAANEVIQKMAQADPFLAGEAINKIVSTKMVKQSLEKLTGLELNGLGMDEWRHNTPLREAVTRQIELMHPADFKQIQVTFDGRIKQLKSWIEELNKIVN